MKKVIAIAYGDIHFHIWNDFWNHNGITRLDWSIKAHQTIINRAKKLEVPTLFLGDFLHNDKNIRNQLAEDLLPYCIKTYRKHTEYAISGNHDQEGSNTLENRSPNYIRLLRRVTKGVQCVDFSCRKTKNFNVYGVPYISHNKGFTEYVEGLKKDINPNKLNILLIHSDLPKAISCTGYRFDNVINIPIKLSGLFKGFDLVIGGHIHKPQRLGPNIFITGSPIHQSRGDSGVDMGYWEIFEDATYRFVKLQGFPEFIYYEDKPEDEFNYWTKIDKPKKSKINTKTTSVNIKTVKGRKKLIKSYIREKNIKNKNQKKYLNKYLV